MQRAYENEANDTGYEDYGPDYAAVTPRLALPWSLGWPNLTALSAMLGLVAGLVMWGALALVVVSGLQSISTPVTAAELLAGEDAVDCAALANEAQPSEADRILIDTHCEPELASELQTAR